jgi:hypothetical protein
LLPPLPPNVTSRTPFIGGGSDEVTPGAGCADMKAGSRVKRIQGYRMDDFMIVE